MTKIEKKFTTDIFLYQKLQVTYLYLGHHKGRPSYRRSLQPSRENIQHFKMINFVALIYFSESFVATWILIQSTKILALYLGYYWSPTRVKEKPTGIQDQYEKSGSVPVAFV